MKIRVFRDMCNGVYRIVVATGDWSQGDLDLMVQFGEPEINVGGEIKYYFDEESSGSSGSSDSSSSSEDHGLKTKTFGDEFVRVLHGFPYARGFDSRDYGSVDEAVTVGVAWKEKIIERINEAVVALRANTTPLPTEEVSEI